MGFRVTGMMADAEAPATPNPETGPDAATQLDEDSDSGSGAFSSAICWPRPLEQQNAIATHHLHRFFIHPVHRNRCLERSDGSNSSHRFPASGNGREEK
jgi:hypothetical protein